LVGFDPHPVRHHDARLEPAPHQSQHARIAHLPGEAIHQALMVDAVEELRQVNVHHRLTSGLKNASWLRRKAVGAPRPRRKPWLLGWKVSSKIAPGL